MWPWRRRADRRSADAPAPASPPAPSGQWRSLAPIQRSIADAPVVNPPERIRSSLASWRDPRLLADLGHAVGEDEPSGVIGDPHPAPAALGERGARDAGPAAPSVQRLPVLGHEGAGEPGARGGAVGEPVRRPVHDPAPGPAEVAAPRVAGPALPPIAGAAVAAAPPMPVRASSPPPLPTTPGSPAGALPTLGSAAASPRAPGTPAIAPVPPAPPVPPASPTGPAPGGARAGDGPRTVSRSVERGAGAGAVPADAAPLPPVPDRPAPHRLGLGAPILSGPALTIGVRAVQRSSEPRPVPPPLPAPAAARPAPAARTARTLAATPTGSRTPPTAPDAGPVGTVAAAELPHPQVAALPRPDEPPVVARLIGDRGPVLVSRSSTMDTPALPALPALPAPPTAPTATARPASRGAPEPGTAGAGTRPSAAMARPGTAVEGRMVTALRGGAVQRVGEAGQRREAPVAGPVATTAPAPAAVTAAPTPSPMPVVGATTVVQASADGPARPPAPAPGDEPDELVAKLFDPLLRRLKAELRMDRDRRGSLTDLRR